MFSITCLPSRAQSNKTGSWDIINLTYHVNSHFGLYTEAEVRSQTISNEFFYHELKAGISYYLPHKTSLFIGFGNYETYQTTGSGSFKKPVTVNEYRLWEQFTLWNNIGSIKIEHRYRIEQRWINGIYSNRFRYRINPIIPINHSSVIACTLFLSAFDEVYFTDTAPYFIRNKVFGGVGYQFSKLLALQVGFTRQFDYRTSDGGSGKNYLQTSVMFNMNHTRNKKEIHLSNMD